MITCIGGVDLINDVGAVFPEAGFPRVVKQKEKKNQLLITDMKSNG